MYCVKPSIHLIKQLKITDLKPYHFLTPSPKVLAVGNFDGVHLGHCYLIEHAKQFAKNLGLTDEVVGVLSFHPHPRQVFNPHYKTLQNLREHLHALAQHVRHIWLLRFKRIQFTYAFEFVLYLKHAGIQALVVGEDFYCGYKRSCNAKDLQKLAKAFGIQVCIVPFLKQTLIHLEDKISSSNIRQLLIHGNLDKANQQLGYHFYVCGKPVAGQKLGRKIGFATLNFLLSKHFCLAYGVYAVHLNYLGKNYQAVANVGKRPTVDAQELIEVHVLPDSARQLDALLLDYKDATSIKTNNDNDLEFLELNLEANMETDFKEFKDSKFKQWLIPINQSYFNIHFLHYLRGQQTFANLDALKHAIAHDIAQAQLFFESH